LLFTSEFQQRNVKDNRLYKKIYNLIEKDYVKIINEDDKKWHIPKILKVFLRIGKEKEI